MVEKRPYRTLGPGHDTFWEWCAKGELRLPKCTACGELHWPVVKACEHCGNTAFDWPRMSGKGTLTSWCTFEKDYYGGMMQMPLDTILVELEEGPLFLSNPKGFSWPEMSLGLPVKVTFIPCEDRAGEFSLPVFEKA